MLTIKGLLSKAELAQIAARMDAESFIDGKATARAGARDVKNNLQLAHGGDAQKEVDQIIRTAYRKNDAMRELVMPVKIMPMRVSRYEVGMEYGWHVDAVTMTNPKGELVRTDVASTVFLADPDEYDGGELTVMTPMGKVQVKLDAGDAIVYPATTVHRVEPVTRGVRKVAVTWIQSMIASAEKRQLLQELTTAIMDLKARDPKAPELPKYSAVHHNLVRMWGET